MLVGGVADPVGQVLHRLDLHDAAAQEVGEPGEGDRAEALDPGHAVAGAVKGGLVEVDVEDDLRLRAG